MSDLYKILGFDAATRENVTTSDIKKAYRQEALKWHPDKHPEETRAQAEAHFKDLAHAFEILSDDKKRRLYDQGGMAAVERGSAAPPMPTAEEEFDARRHRTDRMYADRHVPPRERATHGGSSFVFRDPFEIFNAVFRDMDRMMSGVMHDARRGTPSGFGGFGGGSIFDDPFFRTPFGSDPFFASPFGGRSGLLFGPSLMPAFGAGPVLAGATPPLRAPLQPPAGTWVSQGTVVHATSLPAAGTSHATTQMFSFSGSAGGAAASGQARQGKSVTVETRIENGQRVTRTVQRTYMPDGTVREEVTGPSVAAAAPPRVAGPAEVAPGHEQRYRAPPTAIAQPQWAGSLGSVPPQHPHPQPQPQPQPQRPAMALLYPQSQARPSVFAGLPPSRPSVLTAGMRQMRSATSGPGAGRVGPMGHVSLPQFAPQRSVAVGVGGRY